jgi:hypothetical protein
MRHDPAGASIVIMLRSLKLHGMAHAQDVFVRTDDEEYETQSRKLSL